MTTIITIATISAGIVALVIAVFDRDRRGRRKGFHA
jgi:hypothetical protein